MFGSTGGSPPVPTHCCYSSSPVDAEDGDGGENGGSTQVGRSSSLPTDECYISKKHELLASYMYFFHKFCPFFSFAFKLNFFGFSYPQSCRQPAEQPARVLPGRLDWCARPGRCGRIRWKKHGGGAGAHRLYGDQNWQGELCHVRFVRNSVWLIHFLTIRLNVSLSLSNSL